MSEGLASASYPTLALQRQHDGIRLCFQVMAEDLDGPLNSLVHYSIVNGDPQKQFIINRQSGEIRVNRRLDREEVSRSFQMICSCQRDHDPDLNHKIASSLTLKIFSTSPIKLPIAKSFIFLYSILYGRSSQKMLSLYSYHNGASRGSNCCLLQVPHYSLTIQATDGGNPPLSTAVQVTITVSDINDNAPTFSQISHNLFLQVWIWGPPFPP